MGRAKFGSIMDLSERNRKAHTKGRRKKCPAPIVPALDCNATVPMQDKGGDDMERDGKPLTVACYVPFNFETIRKPAKDDAAGQAKLRKLLDSHAAVEKRGKGVCLVSGRDGDENGGTYAGAWQRTDDGAPDVRGIHVNGPWSQVYLPVGFVAALAEPAFVRALLAAADQSIGTVTADVETD